MNLIRKTRDYKLFQYLDFEIAFGRTQLGNDNILKQYWDVRDSCMWYHLAYETSAHVIVYQNKSNLDISSLDDVILREFFPKYELIKKSKNPTVMKCWLKDLTMTETLGMVYTRNETYIKQ